MAAPRKNSSAQEAFISSLTTSGALDEGSGFERAFGASETNDQYATRLAAWKASKGGGGGAPAPSQSGNGGPIASPAPSGASMGASPAIQGLMGAPDETAVLGGSNALKQGLGQRIYPSLQGLLRARAY